MALTCPMSTIKPLQHRTKIVATIGPASRSREMIRAMVLAGMNVARLNFSHGSYGDHAQTVAVLREISRELETPITLLQDLQGPKIRVQELPPDGLNLEKGMTIVLVPNHPHDNTPTLDPNHAFTIGIDYPHLANEAKPGLRVLLDDGLLSLTIVSVSGQNVICDVVEGGCLKSHKGVNLPDLNLTLPS